MHRQFRAADGNDWVWLDDGAGLVRSSHMHVVSAVRGALPPDSTDPPPSNEELAAFLEQWSAKRRGEAQYRHVRGYRWSTTSGAETGVDMVRFGALLTAPNVTVWRAALPGEMAAPLIVRLGEGPIAIIAPLVD